MRLFETKRAAWCNGVLWGFALGVFACLLWSVLT